MCKCVYIILKHISNVKLAYLPLSQLNIQKSEVLPSDIQRIGVHLHPYYLLHPLTFGQLSAPPRMSSSRDCLKVCAVIYICVIFYIGTTKTSKTQTSWREKRQIVQHSQEEAKIIWTKLCDCFFKKRMLRGKQSKVAVGIRLCSILSCLGCTPLSV